MKLRRIIVRLDPQPRSRTLLEAAAALAGRMEAELVGLFVENVDLLHFAGLPFAREVGLASAARRELDVGTMERSLRAHARAAERQLASVAVSTSVRWSFRVVRGAAGAGLESAEEADLVVAGLEAPREPEPPSAVRVVRAGDFEALRAALEEGGCAIVLAGDDTETGATLRQLLEQQLTGDR